MTARDGRAGANAQARGETPEQQADRNFADLLQELRVVQTGVQILFAFLLTIAFTPRFADLPQGQKRLYVLTLVLAVGATVLLVAPVSVHRLLFHQGLKRSVVTVGNYCAMGGLALLGLSICCSVLLVVEVVLPGRWAESLALGALAAFVALWYAVPLVLRARHRS